MEWVHGEGKGINHYGVVLGSVVIATKEMKEDIETRGVHTELAVGKIVEATWCACGGYEGVDAFEVGGGGGVAVRDGVN